MLILGFAGCTVWNDISREEYRSNAEYIIGLEMEGKLEEAVASGRLRQSTADRIESYRNEFGPIRWYKIVSVAGYPKGIDHGAASVIVVRGDQIFEAWITSQHSYILFWGRGSGKLTERTTAPPTGVQSFSEGCEPWTWWQQHPNPERVKSGRFV